MIQLAQARLCLACGFFWRAVLPLILSLPKEDLCVEGVEDCDFGLSKSIAGGFIAFSVAGLNELQDHGRGPDCDGGELDQGAGVGKLAVFDAQAMQFHPTKELLDGPAHPVPIDHLPGGGHVTHFVRRQQAPMNRIGALGRVKLQERTFIVSGKRSKSERLS